MIKYKAVSNAIHPNTGERCNAVYFRHYHMYDTFNMGSTGKRCTLSVTIDKCFDVGSKLNKDSIALYNSCTMNCLDVFFKP